jgi:alpha-L-glutamate ligase-like protein
VALAYFHRLRKWGILGINKRNAHYTLAHNERRYYPLVDDKARTKELAIRHGITVPELYGVIHCHHQIPQILEISRLHPQFVLKPAMGSQGEGILLLSRHDDGRFERTNGQMLSADDLLHYVSGILSGLYSLGGQDDKALIEYQVENHPVFEDVTYRGIPDVRIIVYQGVPVMSMLRLPTRESNGKANLHQGALGVGVNLSEGITLHGVHHDRSVHLHPDSGRPIAGIMIPYWQEILRIAALAYDMTGLGYLGVDVVIDRTAGPMVLEFNARPGLSIQIANHAGLLPRLEAVDAAAPAQLALEERVRLGQEIVGAEQS